MSNFDYHIGFRPPPKKRKRKHSLKLRTKRIIYVAALVILSVFLFQLFTSNPNSKNKVSIIQSTDLKNNTETNTSNLDFQNEFTSYREQDNLDDQLKEKPSKILINHILTDSDLDTTLENQDENKAVQLTKNEITHKTKEDQNTQITNIIKQIAADKVIISSTVTKVKTPTSQYFEIETIPYERLIKSQFIMDLTPSSESISQNTDETKNILRIYQKNLDQLSDEKELDDLLNTIYLKYLDN